MQSVDHPLCGRIGRIGWSGRERSGDWISTISSNSNYKVKKRKKKKKKKKKFNQQATIFQIWTNWLEVSPNPARIALDLVRSHQIWRDLFQILWDLSRSSEISFGGAQWDRVGVTCLMRSSRSCSAQWRRSSQKGDRDSMSLTMKERERERKRFDHGGEKLRPWRWVRPCGWETGATRKWESEWEVESEKLGIGKWD